jgi:hypothetical protein
MTTYFVDGTNGSNSNDGLAAATGGGHGPYLTIGKALAAGGAPVGGDTVYIAPGHYREEVTIGITPASELKVIGDVRRSQAWAATTPNGPVIMSNFLTNDVVPPVDSNPVITFNGKSFLSFYDMWFSAMSTSVLQATTTGSAHLKFYGCFIQGATSGGNTCFTMTTTSGFDPDVLFERCILAANITTLIFLSQPLHTANYTLSFVARNCLFYGYGQASQGIRIDITTNGGNTGKPAGFVFTHNTVHGCGLLLNMPNGNFQANSITMEDNFVVGQAVLVSSAGAGMVVSNHNRTLSGNSMTNTPLGTNDQDNSGGGQYAGFPLVEYGQSELWGFTPRPFLSVWPGALALASFGEGTDVSAVDLRNRPRPSGGGRASTVTPLTGQAATAGSATTITKTGAGWTTNVYATMVCRITSGTGAGQRRWIASNTATVLTVSPSWRTTPDNTSVFNIEAAGAEKAVGCYEPQEHYFPGGSANADGGVGDCLEIIGPGTVKMRVAVPASATVISVKVKWDANHADTNKPRAIMLWQPAIGVDDAGDTTQHWHEVKTATGTAGSGYETLTFSSITPTAVGFVEILLQSRAALGNGIAYFDTFAVA